ncbi:hypothetical protein BDZ89DRAFT_1117575 [Hymenopellis radicata]|nr:hypothetical protein BDZ89DRAFT_1117575 [Hymenopellis radicata]
MASELPVELKLKIIEYLRYDKTAASTKGLISLCRVWRATTSTIQNHLWRTLTIPATCDPGRSISNLQNAFRGQNAKTLISTVECIVLEDTSEGHELSKSLAQPLASFLYNFCTLQRLELSGLSLNLIPPKKTFHHALKRIALSSLSITDCTLSVLDLYAILNSTARHLKALRLAGNHVVLVRPKFGWHAEYGVDLALLKGLKLDVLELGMKTMGDRRLYEVLAKDVDPPLGGARRLMLSSWEVGDTETMWCLVEKQGIGHLDLLGMTGPIHGGLAPLSLSSIRTLAIPIWMHDWDIVKPQLSWYMDTFARSSEPNLLRCITLDVCLRLTTSAATQTPKIIGGDEATLLHAVDCALSTSGAQRIELRLHVCNDSPESDLFVKKRIKDYRDWILLSCFPFVGERLESVGEEEDREDDLNFDARHFQWIDNIY